MHIFWYVSLFVMPHVKHVLDIGASFVENSLSITLSFTIADCHRLARVLLSGVLAVRGVPLHPREPPHRPGGVVLGRYPSGGLVTP